MVQGDRKDFWYSCINQSVAAADMTMNIMGMNVNITCQQPNGATRLSAVAALSALLAFVAM
jgi:hypothetical protein